MRHEPGILLTGYVDENTKRDLYLNALASARHWWKDLAFPCSMRHVSACRHL